MCVCVSLTGRRCRLPDDGVWSWGCCNRVSPRRIHVCFVDLCSSLIAQCVFTVFPDIHSARWRQTPDSPNMSELFTFPAALDAGLVESLEQQQTEVQQFKQHTEKNMCNHQEGGWPCSLCEHAKVTRHFDSIYKVTEPPHPTLHQPTSSSSSSSMLVVEQPSELSRCLSDSRGRFREALAPEMLLSCTFHLHLWTLQRGLCGSVCVCARACVES